MPMAEAPLPCGLRAAPPGALLPNAPFFPVTPIRQLLPHRPSRVPDRAVRTQASNLVRAQERKKKAKTHLKLTSLGCARRARAQEQNASSVKSVRAQVKLALSASISPSSPTHRTLHNRSERCIGSPCRGSKCRRALLLGGPPPSRVPSLAEQLASRSPCRPGGRQHEGTHRTINSGNNTSYKTHQLSSFPFCPGFTSAARVDTSYVNLVPLLHPLQVLEVLGMYTVGYWLGQSGFPRDLHFGHSRFTSALHTS